MRVVVERSYLSGVLPKFDMMTANQMLRLHTGYSVIRTFEWN